MTVRIAVLGLDHWYAALPFARAVQAHPEAELVVIADPDQVRSSEIAAELAVEASTDPAAAAIRPDVDAVACFSSVDRSPALCIAAAGAGKHIVAVKPLAMDLTTADTVVAAVEEAGVVFVPSEARRTSALALRLRSLLGDGPVGDLRAGTFSMHSAVPAPWPGQVGPSWWTDPDRAPGGGWIDHAVYQIDRMRWLFDSPVRAVSGTIGNLRHPDLDVEDYGHAVYTLESGAVVTVEDTWIASSGDSQTTMHLVGTRGSVHVDSRTGTISVSRGDRTWDTETMPDDGFDTLDVLLAAVVDGVPAPADVHAARETLELALRFYENAVRV
ncbi:Gfo/Idh/MocA family protein [Microbacterium resistens]|uniref:Gfo/Idh/MocA family protein n=1 Tax=Microbacterium resistens TaxID=156977 RepID=UPI000829CBBE|nr:Gfo/Idh/MocA family oxidoreductase [Microbacterium resistens]MBW1640794.1 Gfo/Idh/MocA family oxidoreductase [Microbacterium resistens]